VKVHRQCPTSSATSSPGVDHVFADLPFLELPRDQLNLLAGDYRSDADGSVFSLSGSQAGLVYSREGSESTYRPVAPGLFVLEGRPDVALRFENPGTPDAEAVIDNCGHELRRGRRSTPQ
jgi:hypothetical protein